MTGELPEDAAPDLTSPSQRTNLARWPALNPASRCLKATESDFESAFASLTFGALSRPRSSCRRAVSHIPQRLTHAGAFLGCDHRLGFQAAVFHKSLSTLALSSGGSFSNSAASASISGSRIRSSLLASSAGVGQRKMVGTGI